MRIVFLTIAFAFSLTLSAQESRQKLTASEIWQAGLPPIVQYSPSDYRAHPQNWSFVQDNNGIMYVGNTSGILEYDGVSWRLVPLPNGSPAKSFAKSDDGTVYVGGVHEFFSPQRHEDTNLWIDFLRVSAVKKMAHVQIGTHANIYVPSRKLANVNS